MPAQRSTNLFTKPMNLNSSDFMIRGDAPRFLQDVRVLNLEGSSYVVTNLLGNEQWFEISDGFEVVATKEFNQILYIISWNSGTGALELGSYPSPSYDDVPANDIYHYRPLNNLDNDIFRTTVFGTAVKPIIQQLEIQPDYDESVNLCFTIVDLPPRIVNSKFKIDKTQASLTLTIPADRPDGAHSNDYTSASLDQETRLILFSDKVLGITFNSIASGGKLKPGNYVYVFRYMTEDFVQTNIIGQSSVCQVAFGESTNFIRGGNESEQTFKSIKLNLTNLDTDFRYIKVQLQYSAGQDGELIQYLEFVKPIAITTASMTFTHTGFEELSEISLDDIGLDYAAIESARASTQVGGFYFVGGIKQRSFDFTAFQAAAATITPTFRKRLISASGSRPGYQDPANVYNYMGSFGGETYPYGVVFIMPGNNLSPVFPIAGLRPDAASVTEEPATISSFSDSNGLVTFPYHKNWMPFHSGNIQARYLELDLTLIPSQIKQDSIGFFIVRGERRPSMLTQGILVPVIRVPPFESMAGMTGSGGNDGDPFYYFQFTDGDEEGRYKCVPCMDHIMEAFNLDELGSSFDPIWVMDEALKRINGFMPIYMNDLNAINPASVNNFPTDRWALISGEAMMNEPFYITNLQRDSPYVLQLAKIQFSVTGEVECHVFGGGQNLGLNYNFSQFIERYSTSNRQIKEINYVPEGTFATGSQFGSKALFRVPYQDSSGSTKAYTVHQHYEPYFGIQMNSNLLDITKASDNPYDGNTRIGGSLRTADRAVTSAQQYDNLNDTVNGAFLVNLYPSPTNPTSSQLYPDISGVSYRQVSKRYAWADVPGTNKIDVYGGDCYIGKFYRKLNRSGFNDPSTSGTQPHPRANIDAGLMVSWYQESKYNPALREPRQVDAGELTKRSFFPYETAGDFIKYRNYRLPETTAHSEGYAVVIPPKYEVTAPSLAPFIANNFFNRIHHSERHIPNAFRNGYRSMLPASFRDYDSAVGNIVGLFNHRGRLLVVCEHGVGITDIEQRIQTGQDAAGAIYVKPEDVLPPTLTWLSRELGCQDHTSFVQSPSSVYFIDRSKNKICQVRDLLSVISDETVSSYIELTGVVNPRSGYDFKYAEVLFTTDSWTLCYKEGMEKFTSFYSAKPNNWARRADELYSFPGTDKTQAYKHNIEGVYTFFGQTNECIVEFVMNQNPNMTKVLDYINIMSNENPPAKVEFYTYNQATGIGPIINLGAVNQYTIVNSGTDVLTEEPTIMYRDKKFVVQVPNRTVYNPGSAGDVWNIDDRIRDKYIIIRLTYVTDLPLELSAVLSIFRQSFS